MIREQRWSVSPACPHRIEIQGFLEQMNKIDIIIERSPANQAEIDRKFIRLLLDQWDGTGSFANYLRITLPVMWAGYVKLN